MRRFGMNMGWKMLSHSVESQHLENMDLTLSASRIKCVLSNAVDDNKTFEEPLSSACMLARGVFSFMGCRL